MATFDLVSDFGAVGDGSTDNTAAFDALEAALKTDGGGKVNVPPGIFATQRVRLPSYAQLLGEPDRSILSVHPSTPLGVPGVAPAWFVRNADFSLTDGARLNAGIVIDGIVLDGADWGYPRWLSNPATGAAVTDPDADYYDAATNPAGPIGNPAWAALPSSVCAAQSCAGGALTINGPGGNGVTVAGGVAALSPARRVTITTTADNTGRTVTVTGTACDGTAKSVAFALGPAGTTTVPTWDVAVLDYKGQRGLSSYGSHVFKTVTAASADGPIVGTVSVGHADFDIDALVDAGTRRNPGSDVYRAIALAMFKVDGVVLRDVVLRDFQCLGYAASGCRDEDGERLQFERIGRPDGPNFAFCIGSYLQPWSTDPAMAHCEAPSYRKMRFTDCERIPIVGGPTWGGGLIEDVVIRGGKEAGVYLTNQTGWAGGGLAIYRHIRMSGIVPSDVVGKGYDCAGAQNYAIEDFWVEDVDQEGFDLTDSLHGRLGRGVIKNAGRATVQTMPFGPNGERWAFNRGQPRIAGTAPNPARLVHAKVGDAGGGHDDLRIEDVRHISDNGRTTAIIGVMGSGQRAGDLEIAGGSVTEAAAVPFWDPDSSGQAFSATARLVQRAIRGHVSEGAVLVQRTYSGLGCYDIPVGFRPSRVVVLANAADGSAKFSVGETHWERRTDPGHSGSGQFASIAATAQSVQLFTNRVVQIVDPVSRALIFDAGISPWGEQGFKFNVLTAAVAVNVSMLCYP